MLVSWNWLKQYVLLDMPSEQLEQRLMMAGLNHEETSEVGGDLCIDLEVTSNRPDCLGHIGVAREVAALWQRELKLPAAQPAETGPPVETLTKVTLECPELCPRYTARVIRGVKIGPSPAWLARRLETIGQKPINNVVDATNYVLFECGQPLHAFDLARLQGPEIIVRPSRDKEQFTAINHEQYELPPGTCVIADAKVPVALGGVMGGVDSEVSDATVDLLIESAEFDPVSIRNTARALNLHSPSSYRFERGLDPVGVEWASRRCCELILETAGGELAAGIIDTGRQPEPRKPIVLRLPQLERVLGIQIDAEEVRRILKLLGLQEKRADSNEVEVVPPSWRRDLEREIDLVEEVARIHGYHEIPEDVVVPLAPSHRTDHDRVLNKVRGTLTALGYDEAMTLSAVSLELGSTFSPWSGEPPLAAPTAVLRGADHLRQSLIPSLLVARRTNEALANTVIELFETARVYLARAGKLPEEYWMIGLTSGSDYFHIKGAVEAIVAELNPAALVDARETNQPLLSEKSAELYLGDTLLGYAGELSAEGLKQFELRRPASVAELKLAALLEIAQLVPQYRPQPPFPASERDLNFVVDEAVRYGDVAGTVRGEAGPLLEGLAYRETFRDEKLLGPGKKSLLVTLTFRGQDETLTSEQVEKFVHRAVTACKARHGAELRA